MKKLCLSILLLSVIATADAQTNNSSIPFLVPPSPIAATFGSLGNLGIQGIQKPGGLQGTPTPPPSYTNISATDLTNFIKQLKQALCSAAGDSDIKVTISPDASGKMLGIGSNSLGGPSSSIEIDFHCKG